MNLFDQEPTDRVSTLTHDACTLCAADVGEFDLVYSNSVIDLVGGHTPRMAFASIVHELAGRHWLQTPNRYFPIDACTLFPFQPSLPS